MRAEEPPIPTLLETVNGVPVPLLYFNLCPVIKPWFGRRIKLLQLLPGCPSCGGINLLVPPIPESDPISGRRVPSLVFTLTTLWVPRPDRLKVSPSSTYVPIPASILTTCVVVPIPILDCGLNINNLLRSMFKLVLIPIEKVNLFWSIDTLLPAWWNVWAIPTCLKTLYLFKVVSISKTLSLSSLLPTTNISPTTMSSSLLLPPTTSVNSKKAVEPVPWVNDPACPKLFWAVKVPAVLTVSATPMVDVIEDTPMVLGPSRNLISPVPIPEILTKSLFCNPWGASAIPTPNPFP